MRRSDRCVPDPLGSGARWRDERRSLAINARNQKRGDCKDRKREKGRERKRERERRERGEREERKQERENERKKEKERGRKSEAGRRSKEREEESSARVEAADGQTLRDPQAGVFKLRPLRRLPFCRGRENGWKKGMMLARGGKPGGKERKRQG